MIEYGSASNEQLHGEGPRETHPGPFAMQWPGVMRVVKSITPMLPVGTLVFSIS